MKYSQLTGFIFCIALIIICFLPWSVVQSKSLIITGLHAESAGYGRPGLLNIILSSVIAIFFALPFIWAKRTNVLIAALNISWSIRNFLLVTACSAGECPQKQAGIYLLLILSFAIMFCTFFPKINVAEKKFKS